MNKSAAINLLIDTFSNKFDKKLFTKFIVNLFGPKFTQYINKELEPKNKFKEFVNGNYEIIGTFKDDENNNIDVLVVNIKNTKFVERARTAQRNLIAHYLKLKHREAVLVAFVSSDQSDWRFSLVKLEYQWREQNNKLKVEEKLSLAKRWSFLVGVHEGSHTAKSRFLPLLVDIEQPTLKEIENAFDIEIVTKEFFESYKNLFNDFREQLENLLKDDKKLKEEFENKNISTVDFSKKTLGQIVFLYFLQKKGWFGVDAKKEWGNGQKKFIRVLFDRRADYGKNFFNDILEPLFYEALNKDRRKSDSVYPNLNGCKMPFLNGGLFSPMNNYDWKLTNILIPDDLFSNVTKDNEGMGILDVFDRYNFTVNESEPLEKEVAVDPEMLGKVFENLLDVRDRKSKGAFYTPREIVHYMCKHSLIQYLYHEVKSDIAEFDIEYLIYFGEQIIENDKLIIDYKKKYPNKGVPEHMGVQKLPQSIQSNSKEIDELLRNIKIADPAVGSGAFPLGMLNEIVKARKVLDVYLGVDLSESELKRHTITNSIYGVDLEPGAVEITKLRLWLSLIVDEKIPHPLPNLDHKIMQGNSLISSYKGIELFDEKIINRRISSTDQEKLFEEQSEQLSLGIDKQDSEIKMRDLQFLIEKFIDESNSEKKKILKERIDELKWELIEASLKEENKFSVELENEIKHLRTNNISPFFIWKLEFSDVFMKNGGFDVVIGNPPYIQLQKDNGELADLFERHNFETFARTGDIYCLFYELGNNLLNQSGHLAFITSNKWMRAGYGEKLRKYLSTCTTPKILLDLGSGIFETATVDTNILLFQKNKSNISCIACSVKESLIKEKINLENYIKINKVKLNNFSSEAWIILDKVEQEIKNKVESMGTPLKEWKIKINYGIKTGFNEAFIISGKIKDELVEKDSKNSEILKPILRGRDIFRYNSEFADLWLIATHNGYKIDGTEIPPINIDDYPLIKKHIDSIEEEFQTQKAKSNNKGVLKRSDQGITPYNLRNCAFMGEIENEKIVYSEIVQEPQFYLDKKGYYPEASAFIMTGTNLKFLIAILNSKPFTYFFSKFYAGGGLGNSGYRYKKKFLELVPIPNITFNDQKPFVSIVNQILEITSKDNYNYKKPPVEQINLVKKIDKMVYDLYDLKPDEIKIVESSHR